MDWAKAENARKNVCETARRMAEAGLTVGTWGNVSARVDETYMVITPSGMDYAKLVPEQMVLTHMHTFAYEGALKPSVEVPVHAAILKNRSEIGAVVHVHSTWALTVAAARRDIPPVCDDQVQILGGSVRCAPYTMPGTEEMAQTVLKALEARRGALIANHGSITLGETTDQALTAAIVLEKAAQVYIHAQLLGGGVEISPKDCESFHRFFLTQYGQR